MKIINGKKYITKEDLQNKFFGISQYKPGEKKTKNLFIRAASGTTGKFPTIVLRRIVLNKKLINFLDYSRPFLSIFNINAQRIVWTQTIFSHYKKASRIMALNKKDVEHPLISSIVGNFEPEVIYSMVSFLNFFTDKLCDKKVNIFYKKLKKIYISGETPSIKFLKKIKKVFPTSEIKLVYATAETNILGISCKYLIRKYKDNAIGTYHPPREVSIVNPNQAGVGLISAYTPELSNFLMGDAGKIIEEKCKCGERKTLFFHGRINYDIVNCVGATFHILEVDRVFSSLTDYVRDYCLEIREVFGKGKTLGSVTIKLVPTEKLQTMKNGENFICEFVRKHLQLISLEQ